MFEIYKINNNKFEAKNKSFMAESSRRGSTYASNKNQKDVNCLRRCKRSMRKKIGWNKCTMRCQLRVHLFTLFGSFFLAFFIFLAFYAKYFYQMAVVDNLSTEWPGIL